MSYINANDSGSKIIVDFLVKEINGIEKHSILSPLVSIIKSFFVKYPPLPALIEGRLMDNPSVKYIGKSGDYALCNFAVVIKDKDKNIPNSKGRILNCVAFGKAAEQIEQYYKKGDNIICIGETKENTWKSDKDKQAELRGEKVPKRYQYTVSQLIPTLDLILYLMQSAGAYSEDLSASDDVTQETISDEHGGTESRTDERQEYEVEQNDTPSIMI